LQPFCSRAGRTFWAWLRIVSRLGALRILAIEATARQALFVVVVHPGSDRKREDDS